MYNTGDSQLNGSIIIMHRTNDRLRVMFCSFLGTNFAVQSSAEWGY